MKAVTSEQGLGEIFRAYGATLSARTAAAKKRAAKRVDDLIGDLVPADRRAFQTLANFLIHTSGGRRRKRKEIG